MVYSYEAGGGRWVVEGCGNGVSGCGKCWSVKLAMGVYVNPDKWRIWETESLSAKKACVDASQ